MPLFSALQEQGIGFSSASQLVVNLVCSIRGGLKAKFFWAEKQMHPP